MADEPEEIGAKPAGPDPLGARLALDAATAEEAREYLRRQNDIALLQIENLKKQDEYETSHLRWRRFNDQMRGALQVMVVAVGLLVVAGIGTSLWNAANDRGLVVDAFGVPPDLATRGLTGEVFANKVLDRLSKFQAQTGSARGSASYANNWGDDIKVQIPNTGVSISEFNRALHRWLGHETHISGEVYRTTDGIAISARAGNDSTPIVTGNEADIERLVGKVAESIYRSTQPYRYAVWLSAQGRVAESSAQLQTIIATAEPMEQAWAYNGMAHNTIITGAVAAANAWLHKAIAADRSLVLPRANLVGGESELSHDEQALAAARALMKVAAAGDPTMEERHLTQYVTGARVILAELTGDDTAALALTRNEESIKDVETGRQNETLACALLHDTACFRAALASWEPTTDPDVRAIRQSILQQANAAFERWDAVANAAPAFHDELLHGSPTNAGALRLTDIPLQALAVAHLGDLQRARRLADTMPKDCVLCLRFHAQIEALAHNWRGAGRWFAHAGSLAPSIPQVDTDWGRTMLASGDAGAAIVKFARAHKNGPHFADPLELWGEALMLQNRSDLALAKFEEASRYAPNWGRLHLKWGEALYYAGNRDDAKKQFAIAAMLILAPSEKAELARVRV